MKEKIKKWFKNITIIKTIMIILLFIIFIILAINLYFKYINLNKSDDFLKLHSEQCEKGQIISSFEKSIDGKKHNIKCVLPYKCNDGKIPIIKCSSAILEDGGSGCRLSCFEEDF